MRDGKIWLSRGGRGFGPAPFLIAGIVNVTPDSFSDGGEHNRPEGALLWCRKLVEDGAAILDLGGESTRPGSAFVSAEQELERLMPVVAACTRMRDEEDFAAIHVAVDTWRASTAAVVLEAGVDIINDISGASFDPAMAEVLGQFKPGYVLMHTPADPKTMQNVTVYEDFPGVVDAVLHFFEQSMKLLIAAGLPEENIILDPGIGFGKTAEQNIALLRASDRLHSLGRPLYVGLSRKRLLGDLFGIPLEKRDAVTNVATALLAAKGVYVHRVHDVSGAVAALKFMDMVY